MGGVSGFFGRRDQTAAPIEEIQEFGKAGELEGLFEIDWWACSPLVSQST